MAGCGRPRPAWTPLLAALSALLLLSLRPCAGLKATVHPAATECFTENVGAEHFGAVEGGPRIEGAFFVTSRQPHILPAVTMLLYGPSGQLVWSQAHVEVEAHFNVAAQGPGDYRVCFQSHTRADVTVDLVYFSLGHLRRPGQLNVPRGTQENRDKQFATQSHLEEVKRNVLVVGELVDILSGEQRYLQRKLDRHMQTCHSNNRRTLWYTVLEVVTLAAVSVFNVYTVGNMFKGYGVPRYGRISV